MEHLFTNPVAESGANLLGYWTDEYQEWVDEFSFDYAVDQIVAAGGGTLEFVDSSDLQFQIGVWPEGSSTESQGFVTLYFDRAELDRSDYRSGGADQVLLYAKQISDFLTPLFGHGGYDIQWIDFDIREASRSQILERMSWINFLPENLLTTRECQRLKQMSDIDADCDDDPQTILLASTPTDQLSIQSRRNKVIDELNIDN